MSDKFKYRSEENELMDSPDVPKSLLFKNLHELDLLNRTMGGHKNTLKEIRKFFNNKSQAYNIVDIGCGSGDFLKFLANWGRREGFKLKLTGVDINADVIAYFKKHCIDYPEINGVAMDYREFLINSKEIDIVVCTLFCHHLKDHEIIALFQWCKKNEKKFVINDIQRNPWAYYLVLIFTNIFGTKLAKNDGPVSVLRSFTKAELTGMLENAGIKEYSISRKWAFRWLVSG